VLYLARHLLTHLILPAMAAAAGGIVGALAEVLDLG